MPAMLPESDSEDELPPAWEERATSDGFVYYVNHQSKSTQWTHPRTGKMKRVSGELPIGWTRQIEEDTRKVIFVEEKTQRKSYTDPRLAFAVEEAPERLSELRQRFDGGTNALQVLHGRDLNGKVALITGANTGIGYETARSLALHGCEIIFACRDEQATRAAIEKLRVEKEAAGQRCKFVPLDLASLRSTKQAAEEVKKGYKHIDMLILNAGVFALPHSITEDGFERTFQVNHLAHHYLTTLLSELFDHTTRIVVVSSESHRMATLPAGGLSETDLCPPQHKFWSMIAYNNSKLCNVLFTVAIVAIEMRETLTDQKAMWYLLAKLELEGDAFVMKEAEQTKPHERLARCLAVYKEAVERLPTKKMHSLCIDTMLQLNSLEESEHDEKAKRKALAGAFKRALVDDLLDEDKLLQYLKLLLHNSNPNEELVMKVINKGLEQYPASVDVWSAYLRYQILQEVGADELERTFSKALNTLPERVSRLVLWKQMFQYYSERPALQGTLEQLFRRAIDQEPEISNHYQPLYLDYLMASFGENLAKVRSEYQRLVRNYTTPLELHTKMASLEASQTPPDVSVWRKCYEHMTLFYGKQDATVWLQYVQFERDHGQPKHMQSLYERAKGALDEDSFATFMAEYELIRNPYIVRY